MCNPDERGWGHFYLWQNTRLPYHSMLARGEAGWLRRLFAFYRRFWDLDRGRAALYYGAEGQYNTEIVHSFGLQPDWVYGLDRQGKPDGYAENRWGGAVDISPGLELLHLMLDYYEYQQDDEFLRDDLLPYAHDLLRFVETRFPERTDGKIVLRPDPIGRNVLGYDQTRSQSWRACERSCAESSRLPANKVADREFYRRMQSLIPELAASKMPTVLTSSRRPGAYKPERKNCEAPPFYAVFPFRLFGPGIDARRRYLSPCCCGSPEALRPFILGRRPEYPSYSGWQQHGMVAALLGLSEDARTILENNCALKNPGLPLPGHVGPHLRCGPRRRSRRQHPDHFAAHGVSGRWGQDPPPARPGRGTGTSRSSCMRRATRRWSACTGTARSKELAVDAGKPAKRRAFARPGAEAAE